MLDRGRGSLSMGRLIIGRRRITILAGRISCSARATVCFDAPSMTAVFKVLSSFVRAVAATACSHGQRTRQSRYQPFGATFRTTAVTPDLLLHVSRLGKARRSSLYRGTPVASIAMDTSLRSTGSTQGRRPIEGRETAPVPRRKRSAATDPMKIVDLNMPAPPCPGVPDP